MRLSYAVTPQKAPIREALTDSYSGNGTGQLAGKAPAQ